ncbi:unnamed protein product [Urochloa decumbens]|uniref:Uncharacterized protein n=1 Tax=Urochloa decumbens TaxID=240449 RepID=A0ABC8Z6B0_9POAL
MATPPARPYRFPALPEKDKDDDDDDQVATRCSRQSCGTCSASAVASCVALCLCPCAVLSCLTLALVKAPYAAGRRCVARLARRRLRKARARRRVRDLDDEQHQQQQKQCPRRSKQQDWGELARAAAVGGGAEARAKVSSRMDASEEVWADMYQVGLWGFGRLSFSAPADGGGGGDSEEDGDDAASE